MPGLWQKLPAAGAHLAGSRKIPVVSIRRHPRELVRTRRQGQSLGINLQAFCGVPSLNSLVNNRHCGDRRRLIRLVDGRLRVAAVVVFRRHGTVKTHVIDSANARWRNDDSHFRRRLHESIIRLWRCWRNGCPLNTFQPGIRLAVQWSGSSGNA